MREGDAAVGLVGGEVDGSDGGQTVAGHGVRADGVSGGVHLGALVPDVIHGPRIVRFHVQLREDRRIAT